jgi:PPM family protein phosphatase
MIESFGITDPGCVRGNNEDCFLVCPKLGLYVVADGMGGAQAGEHASRLAVDTVAEVMEQSPQPATGDDLVQAFAQANQRVMQAAQADPEREGMGTTLVAGIEEGDQFFVASVGDSRAYLYQNGKLEALTEDQTWVNDVGRRLGLDEATLKVHPMRHVLTMAIGVAGQLRVHTYHVDAPKGSLILLCSDGLHGVASDEVILKVLGSDGDLEAKARKLIEAARAEGGPDNITAVLLQRC